MMILKSRLTTFISVLCNYLEYIWICLCWANWKNGWSMSTHVFLWERDLKIWEKIFAQKLTNARCCFLSEAQDISKIAVTFSLKVKIFTMPDKFMGDHKRSNMRIFVATAFLLSFAVQTQGFQASLGTTTTHSRVLSPPFTTAGGLRRHVNNGNYVSNGVSKLDYQCYSGTSSNLYMSSSSHGYMVSKTTIITSSL